MFEQCVVCGTSQELHSENKLQDEDDIMAEYTGDHPSLGEITYPAMTRTMQDGV